MKRWSWGVTMIGLMFAATAWGSIDQYLGTYYLVAQNCQGTVPASVAVLKAADRVFVQTNDGYVYAGAIAASGTTVITNGPRTICSGTIVGRVFGGNCVDSKGVSCAVQYQK